MFTANRVIHCYTHGIFAKHLFDTHLSGLGYLHQYALTSLSQVKRKVLLPSYCLTIVSEDCSSNHGRNETRGDYLAVLIKVPTLTKGINRESRHCAWSDAEAAVARNLSGSQEAELRQDAKAFSHGALFLPAIYAAFPSCCHHDSNITLIPSSPLDMTVT